MTRKNKYNGCYTIDFEHISKGEKPFGGKNLDTLAQTGTKRKLQPPLKLAGLGSDIKDKSVLTAKAKKKFISQKVVSELIKIARKKGDLEMGKTLRNTFYCLNNVVVADNKLFGHYCGNRICKVCMGKRKAQIINKYLPVLKTWSTPHMVTLTAKSCYAKDLDSRIRAMKRAFKLILSKSKKRHQRGKGLKLMGIKSLECNFNPDRRTYNPHYHVIVPNWEMAILLKREWMKLWTKKFTNGWAQDIRPIKNNVEGLIEVVKYGCKIFTEPNPSHKNKKSVTHYVYISALYNILSSMRGIRLFDRFGFNLSKANNEQAVNIHTVIEYEELFYHSDVQDWVNENVR